MISSNNLLESSSADKTESSRVTLFDTGESSKGSIGSRAKSRFKRRVFEAIDWQGCMVRSELDGHPLFKCTHCTFGSEWLNVVRHVQRVHKLLLTADRSHRNCKALWFCDKCSYKTPRLNLMFSHLLHHGATATAGKLACKSCNYCTNSQVDLEQHNVLCLGGMSDPGVDKSHDVSVERNLKCMFCETTFCTGKGLDDHIQSTHHKDIKSHACSKCSKSYLSQLKLKKHMWMAHGESAIAQKVIDQRSVVFCPYCRYYSNRKQILKNHISSHHYQQLKSHTKISLASENSGNTLTKSLSSVKQRPKELSGKKFHCSNCSFQTKWKVALSRHELKKHQLTETKRNEHEKMNLCKSSSPDKLEIGTLENAYCEVTKDEHIDELKSGLDEGDVVNHKASDILLREFNYKTAIAESFQNTAKPTGQPESNGICNPEVLPACHAELKTCKKDTTNQAANFRTGRTTFCCKYCLKDCKDTRRLARHMSSHLNLRQFKCKKCDYRCNAREYLITHARSKHNLLETSAFLVKLSPTEALATIEDYKSRFPVTKKPTLALDCIPVNELVLDGAVTSDPCRNNLSMDNLVKSQSPDDFDKNVKSQVGHHACKVCSKVFCTPRRLAVHEVSHSGFKMYKCKKCDHRSNYKGNIKKHAYTVHRIKSSMPFVIELPPAELKQTLDVRPSVDNDLFEQSKHNIHSSSAAEDSSCFKSSISVPSVQRLSKQVVTHSLRPFKCGECGQRFKFRSNVINHLQKFHKILMPDCESFVIQLSPLEAKETRSQAQAAQKLQEGYSSKHQVTARKTRPVESCHDRRLPVVVPIADQQLSPNNEADVVDLSSISNDAFCLDDLKKKEAWNYYHHKKPDSCANYKPFMCTECGYRSRWSSNVYHHRRVKNHTKARVVKVQRGDAKKLRSAVCSINAISKNRRFKKHLKSKGLRKYKCDQCGYRSDWRQNVKKHINSLHASAKIVRLSLEEARETFADYQAKISLASQRVIPDVSTAKLKSAAKKRRLKHSAGTIDKLHLRRFSCSLCYFRSNYFHEVSRHSRVKHAGIEGTVQVLPENVARATLTEYNQHYFGSKRRQLIETSVVAPSDAIEDKDEKVSSTLTSSKHEKDGEFSCHLCPYQAARFHHLESHLRMHTARPGCNHKCSHCSYYTSNEHFLKQHLVLHEDASSISVLTRQIDDATSSEPVVVSNSQRVEKKQSLFSCDHCPFICKYSHNLLSHKQLHRRRVSASFKCSHCAFWTKNQHIINQHMEVHKPDYVEKRTSKLLGSDQRLRKLPVVEVTVEPEIIETATIKEKLIANRFSSRTSVKGPRRTTSSPGKLQKNGDVMNVEVDGISLEMMQSASTQSAQVFDVILASEERRTSRNQQLWRCDKCPYSVDSVLQFKRHVYLHGRNLNYECLHCDYSVPSCWRMQEHRILHLVENQNLLHSQSVSNLLFLPSRMQTLHDEPTFGERLDLFEDSPEFPVAGSQPFRCNRCPFVSSRKADFQAHLRCHFSRGDHSCTFCDFSTTVSSVLTSHMVLHFSLPGCDTSSLPPSSSDMHPWKSLQASIESFSTNFSNTVVKINDGPSTNGWTTSKTKLFDDDLERAEESASKKTAGSAPSQHRQLRREKSISSNLDSSMLDNGCYICQYCDRPFVSSDLLAKHEDVHLSHSSL